MAVTVSGIKDLRSAAAALQGLDSKIRLTTRRFVSQGIKGIWNRGEIEQHRVQGRAQNAMLAVASAQTKATVSGMSFSATAQASAKYGIPYAAYEFGDANKTRETYTARSRKGKAYQVTRRTQEQLPGRSSGRRFWAAADKTIKRAMSLYVQTVIKTVHEALEGRR